MPQLTAACKAALPAILAAIKAADGVTNEELSERMGLPFELVRRAAGSLRSAGEIGLIRCGVSCRVEWHMPERAALLRKEAEKGTSNRRNERRRIKYGWQKRERAPMFYSDAVIQRRADPFSPLPFKCKAPASVFHMAAMI